jgi:hypothetical protein
MPDEQDAPHLTETEALASARAVTTLFQRWQLIDEEARELLGGMTAETWSAWKAGRFKPVSPELGTQLSHLLGVHKALRTIFAGDEARVYGWVRLGNAAFGGLPALLVMREGDASRLLNGGTPTSGLLHVRLHLEDQLAGPAEEAAGPLDGPVRLELLLADVQRERMTRADPAVRAGR